MILRWGTHKYGKFSFLSTGYGLAQGGDTTKKAYSPRPPRIPPSTVTLPKEWKMFFEEMFKFLNDHIDDAQMHKQK